MVVKKKKRSKIVKKKNKKKLSSGKLKNNIRSIKKPVRKIKEQETVTDETGFNEEEIKKTIEKNIKKESFEEKNVIPTGFKNFDEAISGGFPSPSAIVVEGPPSEYKVPFLISFAANSLKKRRKAVYICTNDFPENIIKIGKKIGYDLNEIDFVDSYSWMIGRESNYSSASALDPTKLIEVISENLKKNETECIIFDSLSTLFLYHDKRIVEKFVQMLVALVKELNAFLLLSVESGTYSEEMEATLRYLTDGVIIVEEGKIEVKYLEGVKVNKKEMRLDFSRKGIEID